MTSYDVFQDALGWVLAVARDDRLVWLGHTPEQAGAEASRLRWWPDSVHDPAAEPLPEVRRQLDEYFAGQRRSFELPLDPAGTEFQRLCWDALVAIPYGETRSYGAQARAIGRPTAIRAVGRANHDNPIGVIIPCHRVLGADGSLTGYAGGLPMKQALLELEGAIPRKLDF
ncbi:MAG: methylated-DNA--[protein]-cysteine S-methyltransferase [Acidobacteriota bacterium]